MGRKKATRQYMTAARGHQRWPAREKRVEVVLWASWKEGGVRLRARDATSILLGWLTEQAENPPDGSIPPIPRRRLRCLASTPHVHARPAPLLGSVKSTMVSRDPPA
jgi:hypothetical protein